MFDQNIDFQSQNRSFKNYWFLAKIVPTKRPFAWGGGLKRYLAELRLNIHFLSDPGVPGVRQVTWFFQTIWSQDYRDLEAQ